MAGKGGTSNEAGESGSGVGGQAGGEVSEPPAVRITSPEEVTDPNEPGVLSSMELRVVCSVEGDFDESTVQIFMDWDDADQPVEMDANAQGGGEFSADFLLAEVPSGPVEFRCSAEHSTDSDVVGSDRVDTFVDHGPTITPITPADGSFHKLQGALEFQFSVEPTLLAPGDDDAAVDEVRLRVFGVDIDDVRKVDDDLYEVTIDFNDETLFPAPPIDSVPVLIEATNKRKPTPVRESASYSFTIDGDGPVITIDSPESGDVVGGEITLNFSVTDTGSGVDENSVTIEFNESLRSSFAEGEGWARNGNDFTYVFDATILGVSEYQATLNISAKDLAQNESVAGATAVYYLDNVPPIVDLDPGLVREYELDDNVCSRAFDPVGISANDLQVVPQVLPVSRVLVWEQTNVAPGAMQLFFSGTNPESVTLYLQPDPSVPLLVDGADADDVCDELQTVDAVTLADLPRQNLVPIEPDGDSWFLRPGDGDPDLELPPAMGDICDYRDSGTAPEPLCDPPNSDLTRVISQVISSTNPDVNDSAIYGIGVLTDRICTGNQWQISRLEGVEEGWLCLAARAEDFARNVGISAPLRVCYDNPNVAGAAPCATDPSDPPSCTDGCRLPARFAPSIVRIE